MWKVRCILNQNVLPYDHSLYFLENLGSIWWVHSLLIFFFHLQGIPIICNVLNYSNLGCFGGHEAKARISLGHPVSAERTSSQVDKWLPHSHVHFLYFFLASHAITWKVWCPESGPRELPIPRVERSGPASWRIGAIKVCMHGMRGILGHAFSLCV